MKFSVLNIILLLLFIQLSQCSTWINCTSECKECRDSQPSACLSCFADKGHSYSKNLCIEKKDLSLEDYLYNSKGFVRISRNNNYLQAIESGSKVGLASLSSVPQSWWTITLQSTATGYITLSNWEHDKLQIETDILLIKSSENKFQIQLMGENSNKEKCLAESLGAKSCTTFKNETEWQFEYFEEPIEVSYIAAESNGLIFRIQHFSSDVIWKIEDENNNQCKVLAIDGSHVLSFQGGVIVNYTIAEIAQFCQASLSSTFVFQVVEQEVMKTIFIVSLNSDNKEIENVAITDNKNKNSKHYSSDLVKFNISSRVINSSEILFTVLLPPAAASSSIPSTASLIQRNLTFDQQLILKKKNNYESTNQIELQLLIECAGISNEGIYDIIVSLPMKINSGDCFLDVFERVTLLQIASNNTDIYDDSTIKKDNNRSTTLIIIFAVVLGTLIPSIVIVSIFAYQKNIWCCKDRSVHINLIISNNWKRFNIKKNNRRIKLQRKNQRLNSSRKKCMRGECNLAVISYQQFLIMFFYQGLNEKKVKRNLKLL